MKKKILEYTLGLGFTRNPSFKFDDQKRMISFFMDPVTLKAFNFKKMDFQEGKHFDRGLETNKLDRGAKELVIEASKVYGHPQFISREFKYTLELNALIPKTPETILQFFFSKAREVVVGEFHQDLSPKKFLIEQMPFLRKEGAVLALEHLQYHPYQELLDNYVSGKDQEMDPLLRIYLEHLDRGFGITDLNYGYKALLEMAKKNEVRVIAIETATSYRAGYEEGPGSSGPDRMWGLNYMASKIIDKEAKGKKVVYLVGSGHVNISTSEGQNVPGIAEIRGGIPSMVILDSDEQNEIKTQHVNEGRTFSGAISVTPDVTIYQKVK